MSHPPAQHIVVTDWRSVAAPRSLPRVHWRAGVQPLLFCHLDDVLAHLLIVRGRARCAPFRCSRLPYDDASRLVTADGSLQLASTSVSTPARGTLRSCFALGLSALLYCPHASCASLRPPLLAALATFCSRWSTWSCHTWFCWYARALGVACTLPAPCLCRRSRFHPLFAIRADLPVLRPRQGPRFPTRREEDGRVQKGRGDAADEQQAAGVIF